mgnify:CR=1 FL=1
MKRIEGVLNAVANVPRAISLVSIVFMMVLMVCDVSLRYFFNSPIIGTYEIIELAMGVLVFWALSYAQKNKVLVHVTLIVKLLPGRLKYIAYALTSVFSSIIAILVSIALFIQSGNSYNDMVTTSVKYIPLYPFYFLAGIAFSLFTVYVIFDAIKAVLAIFDEDYAQETSSGWSA